MRALPAWLAALPHLTELVLPSQLLPAPAPGRLVLTHEFALLSNPHGLANLVNENVTATGEWEQCIVRAEHVEGRDEYGAAVDYMYSTCDLMRYDGKEINCWPAQYVRQRAQAVGGGSDSEAIAAAALLTSVIKARRRSRAVRSLMSRLAVSAADVAEALLPHGEWEPEEFTTWLDAEPPHVTGRSRRLW